MTTEHTEHDNEPLDEGGTWLLDLVTAVDHLRRGIRPGITVWDAIEEALCQTTDRADEADRAVDPVAVVITRAASGSDAEPSATMQAAIRRWVLTMADRYNDGRHWPHPTARRGFPPPTIGLWAE